MTVSTTILSGLLKSLKSAQQIATSYAEMKNDLPPWSWVDQLSWIIQEVGEELERAKGN